MKKTFFALTLLTLGLPVCSKEIPIKEGKSPVCVYADVGNYIIQEMMPPIPVVYIKNGGTLPLSPYLEVRYTCKEGRNSTLLVQLKTLAPGQEVCVSFDPYEFPSYHPVYQLASIEIITIGCDGAFVEKGCWQESFFTLSESGIVSREQFGACVADFKA
ncbi:hypothetical protein H0W26_00065 [Candidatus Dependentiae bacterium]|nr:hypothetical protein [Candidatus Dependentiae bacterium]